MQFIGAALAAFSMVALAVFLATSLAFGGGGNGLAEIMSWVAYMTMGQVMVLATAILWTRNVVGAQRKDIRRIRRAAEALVELASAEATPGASSETDTGNDETPTVGGQLRAGFNSLIDDVLKDDRPSPVTEITRVGAKDA